MGIIEKQSVQDIANAIRNRNGLTTLYKPREMDEAILNLYSTTKVNSMLDYILPCYEKEATDYTIQYADADRPGSITQLEGNTTQTGTPTPTNPIPIYTVSGDNEVVVSNEQHVTGNSYRVDFGGKNLYDKSQELEGKIINSAGGIGNDSSYNASDFLDVTNNTTITLSTNATSTLMIAEYDSTQTFIKRNIKTNATDYTITTSSTTKYVRICYFATVTTVQLEKRKYSNRVQSLCI